MRFKPSAYIGALVAIAVVLPLQLHELLSHGAWARGKSQTMGHVDKVVEGRRVTVIDYSYEVNGVNYTGEVTDAIFIEGTPEMVTYATANPSVSTLIPDEIDKLYYTALVISVLAFSPLVVLGFMELTWLVKGKKPPPPSSDPMPFGTA